MKSRDESHLVEGLPVRLVLPMSADEHSEPVADEEEDILERPKPLVDDEVAVDVVIYEPVVREGTHVEPAHVESGLGWQDRPRVGGVAHEGQLIRPEVLRVERSE